MRLATNHTSEEVHHDSAEVQLYNQVSPHDDITDHGLCLEKKFMLPLVLDNAQMPGNSSGDSNTAVEHFWRRAFACLMQHAVELGVSLQCSSPL
jgi:hypothetical protein